MKKVILLFSILVLFVFGNFSFGQPTMDGTFDGEGVWGSPKATADANIGWAGAQAKKLYVTFDATYIYLGAEIRASNWQSWAFILNTKSGGASTDSWARNITYTHSSGLPDYDARGHFNAYAEIHSWNGSSWNNSGGLAATEYGENITGSDQDGWVEIRVPKTTIGEFTGDIQFYLTGDQNTHGCFDAVPNDDNATGWADPSVLTVYQEDVPLPVELTSFSAKQSGSNITLNWKTATEVNNYGFEVQKSSDNSTWNKIGVVQGAGNSNSPKEYSYTDKLSNLNGKFYYRLKQMDNDGTISFSKVVEVENLKPSAFNISQNYPNPFNPSTVIKYQIPVDARVSIKVYNVLGNVVATLQNGFQTAGEYSVRVDGSNLASGVYFYKIEAGDFSATKKMLLTK
ncbi:MAG: T9SS type A sorting domain-containing protein [Ignavibacteriaceae bacterium]